MVPVSVGQEEARSRMHGNWLDEEIERLNASEKVSPNDEMLLDESVPGARDHYFIVGRSALRCVEVAMLAAGRSRMHAASWTCPVDTGA